MLNYRQLHYFHAVAKAGSIVQAAEALHLTPQTISGQLAELENSLGVSLFIRQGRRLRLTDAGQQALAHADDIFQLGNELEALLRSPASGNQPCFRVGIADVIPKSIACQLLAPVLRLPEPVRLICQEDKLERLFAELAIHKLDLVIADRPLPSQIGVRGYSHLLGGSDLTFVASRELAQQLGPRFPASLDQAPMLLPGAGAAHRGPLERWFNQQRIQPKVVGEFDDVALMKAFGQIGSGVFPVPSVMLREVERQYQVQPLGQAHDIRLKYHAISVERRLTHPAILAVTTAARQFLFSGPQPTAAD